MTNNLNKAFSIVEITVVILIISLIAAFVTKGIDLNRQANIRAIITQAQTLQTNIYSFEETYNELPGDMLQAFDLWGSDCATGGSAAANCNGNGDGNIEDSGISNDNESFRAWQHMTLAGILEQD